MKIFIFYGLGPVSAIIMMILIGGAIGAGAARNAQFPLLLIATFGAITATLAVVMRLSRQSGWRRWFPFNRFALYGAGWLLGLTLFGVVLSIANLAVDITVIWAGAMPVIMVPAWGIQGAVEEILTRGWLFDRLRRFGDFTAVWAVSAVFMGLHALNPAVNYLALLNVFLFGALLGLFRLQTGNLWAAAGIHSAWNFAQGNLFTMPVSGLADTGASLFNVTIAGAPWLTGGQFGLEASAITTVVLCVSIGLVFFYGWRPQVGLPVGATSGRSA